MPDTNEMIKTMSISAGILLLISMHGKILKDAFSRFIVKKSIETFEHSGHWRLLNIAIEVRVWIEDDSTAKIEEHRMIIELMVCKSIYIEDYKGTSKNNLKIGEQEDDKDESFEVQLAICPNAECVAENKQRISQKGGDPIYSTRLFRTEKLESLNSSMLC